MSLLNALADTENRADRGWSCSNRYSSHNSSGHNSVFSSPPCSIDHWSSPSQHHAMSSRPTPSSSQSYVPELKSSDTDDDILLVDDSGINRQDERKHQNHGSSASYHTLFNNHIPHNQPSPIHQQGHMLKHLNSSSMTTVHSLHSPQHQGGHSHCLTLTVQKRQVAQPGKAGEQFQIERQADQVGNASRKGSQMSQMEPGVCPLQDQQQQRMHCQQIQHPQQPRSGMHAKLPVGHSHSPMPENSSSEGQGMRYCLPQHDSRKDQLQVQHQRRESLQQPQHLQLSTLSSEQQITGVQHYESYSEKRDVCESSKCVHRSVVSMESYPHSAGMSSVQQQITTGGINLQSLPGHCFQVVGNTPLQRYSTYGLKLPDGALKVAVWNGSNMVLHDQGHGALPQLSAADASLSKMWLGNDVQGQGQGPQGDHKSKTFSHCPASDQNSPETPVPAPRVSATNEVWPTPMPSRKPAPVENIVDSLPESPVPDLEARVSESKSSEESNLPESPSSFGQKNSSLTECPLEKAESAQNNTVLEESHAAKIKSKLKEDEEAVAVCRYCGYSSSDVERCESCHRKFADNVKIVIKKRSASEAGLDQSHVQTPESPCKAQAKPSGPVINKRLFYKGKSRSTETSSSKGNPGKECADLMSLQSPRGRGGRRGKGGSPRKSSRSRKSKGCLKEPVTLTISSDEDEPVHKAVPAPSPLRKAEPSLAGEEDVLGITQLINAKKPSSFGKSRRQRMEDEAGRCYPGLLEEDPKHTASSLVSVRGVRVGSLRSIDASVHFLEDQIYFEIASDRTGEQFCFEVFVCEIVCIQYTLDRTQPMAFLRVTPACGVRLRERLKMTLKGLEYFDPGSYDLQKSFIVIIIDDVMDEDGLREVLKSYRARHPGLPAFLQEMKSDDANSLLVNSSPPVSTDKKRQFYHMKSDLNNCILSTKPLQTPQPLFCQTYINAKNQSVSDVGDMSVMDEAAEMEMPVQEGDALRDPPAMLAREERMVSRSPSPTIGFVGPIEKLLTYPPPPIKGAITITNEDLYCLNEGEFLNDVILDFYLKYLVREKLSEEDRQRTHVFSSFFYKRLMQRRTHSSQDSDDTKLTPAQKRHAKVKTWTRHVDIFSKDFLLVPINEHSHWFLAVVCFPGLPSPDYIPYQPSLTSEDETSSPSNEMECCPSVEGEPEHSPSGEDKKEEAMDMDTSPGKSILGKIIDQKAVQEDVPFNIGQKQACILILDSLAGPPRNSVIKTLKEYLQVEWDLKKSVIRNVAKSIRGAVPKVPQQTNYSDCGVFVLQYAETFFENPIANYSIPMKGLEKWFPLNKVEKKREEIRNLILQLQNEYR